MMPLDDYDLYFLVGSEFRLSIFGNEDLIKYDAHDGLAEEIKNFDDLIVGEFEDNYENLPIKTFLGKKPYFSSYFICIFQVINSWAKFAMKNMNLSLLPTMTHLLIGQNWMNLWLLKISVNQQPIE